MLTIGDKLPEYKLKAVVSNNLQTAFEEVDNNSYSGKWKVIFFWPMDFTFICPTEIIEFGKLDSEFKKRDAQVLGASTDSEFVHLAWRQSHPGLKNLSIPMLADVKRQLSQELGILEKNAGVALRATFIVDPEDVIRHVSVNDLSVGRSPKEVLRVLDGLQSNELTPCDWTPGQDTIDLAQVEQV